MMWSIAAAIRSPLDRVWCPSEALTLFASGENLTGTNRRENTGPGQRYLQEIGDYGRTWWVGVTFSP